ncbi:unnamed protein product [Mytilus edulis]|uniref:Farnesoic acid O-methyl transferase domain-containing protein n=1 Tax=Mytilus edulis TaxID=6550 RepID=A0A8S3RMG6_MYTED|nr:unnamed protein product [Mytilus edulis]
MLTRIHNRFIGSLIIIQLKFVFIRGADFHIELHTPNAGNLDAKSSTRNILDYILHLRNYGITGVDEMSSLKIQINTCSDGVVFLSSSDLMDSAEPFYEIVLGGFSNTETYILKRNNDSLHPSSMTDIFFFPTEEINKLKCSAFRPFWISWSGEHIRIGRGSKIGVNMFVEWGDSSSLKVRSIGICTFWGSTGEWKIYIEDLFNGLYSGCHEDNLRADLNILQSLNSSRGVCGSVCSFTDDCIGFNYQSATKRYPS